jgi:hypothetical protein
VPTLAAGDIVIMDNLSCHKDVVGWLANRSSLGVSGERRLASLMPASWNQIAGWLEQMAGLRQAV